MEKVASLRKSSTLIGKRDRLRWTARHGPQSMDSRPAFKRQYRACVSSYSALEFARLARRPAELRRSTANVRERLPLQLLLVAEPAYSLGHVNRPAGHQVAIVQQCQQQRTTASFVMSAINDNAGVEQESGHVSAWILCRRRSYSRRLSDPPLGSLLQFRMIFVISRCRRQLPGLHLS